MIADDDVTVDATEDDSSSESDTVSARLLTLQRLDTEADRLTVRRERLVERDELAARSAGLTEWERRRAEMGTRIDELSAAMEKAEERSAGLRADKRRLEAQLKTVIAPREAEALLHEIATVEQQLDEVDSQELADLTESTTTEETLSAHLRDEEAMRAALAQADDALAAAVADIDRELSEIGAQRDDVRETLGPSMLPRYDHVRGAQGVAVAKLVGHRCAGCHLDLSPAEVDTAKDEAAATGITDCPQCGRMLVV
jgi:predicted  nucleic acid-binding Zn-ribbon protein